MYICLHVCMYIVYIITVLLQEIHHTPCALVNLHIAAAQGEDPGPSLSSLMDADHITVRISPYPMCAYIAAAQGKDPGPSLSSLMDADHITVSEDEDSQDCLVEDVLDRISSVAEHIGLPHDTATLSSFVSSGGIGRQHSGSLKIHNSRGNTTQSFSFLISGHLHADYERLSGLLGLPACCNSQWNRIVKKLEVYVTELAAWSCGQVTQEIKKRGMRSNRLLL